MTAMAAAKKAAAITCIRRSYDFNDAILTTGAGLLGELVQLELGDAV